MNKVVSYFFSDYNFSVQAFKFKRLLYLFLAIKCIYWLAYYDLYFGQNAIAFTKNYSLGTFRDGAFYLYNSNSTSLGFYFILGILICIGASLILKKVPFLFEFIIWILVVNVHNKIYSTLTGGDYLLNLFLFFNCFLAKFQIQNSSIQKSFSIWLHNQAMVALLIQVNLVYFIAAIAKLNSSDWVSGIAIIKLGQIEYFNLFSNPISANNFGGYFLNYLVLFYQLFFPILIWINKIKVPFMIIGILMHLYIAFITGLVGFGIIMLLGYILFWPSKKALN